MEGSSETAESRHYGKRRLNRACAHCKAAKTKCIVDPGSESSCVLISSSSVWQRYLPFVGEGKTGPRRVSDLEQKLDNIVTLLTNPQQTQNVPRGFDNSVPDLWTSPESQDTSNFEPSPSYGDERGVVIAPELRSGSQPYESQSSTSNLDEPPFPAEPMLPIRTTRIIPTQSALPPFRPHQSMSLDPDELLSYFRNHMTEQFVFVVVPEGVTARNLRQQKPFLLDSILLVAAKQSVASQKEAGDKLLAFLGERMLLRGEKSLDLLQGLLVYLAWGNYQFHNSAQMSALLQLAVALLAELELGKMLPSPPDPKKSLVHVVGISSTAPAKALAVHTPDEMRAFLGCFYLSSLFSQCYKKLTAMRYTPYIEHCCTALDEAAEYTTDIYLTALVRIQLFLCKAIESLPLEEADRSSATLRMYVKSMQKELQDFRASLSNSGSYTSRLSYDLLLLHSYSVETSLLEIGLYEPHHTTSQTPNLRHLDQLSSCLTATKTFFDHWFQVPNTIYILLPIVAWSELANVTMAASRLVLLEYPGWDLEHAREVADFANTLDRLAARIEEAMESLFAGNKGADAEGVLLRYAQRLRWVKGWYEARSKEGQVEVLEEVPTMVGGDFMNLDDMFWQDFSGEWRGVYGADIPIG
ncbi:uncharacterized protein LY89DRAFT_781130 [Mollisia scopiformis]|uniref:Zn(2)-C6 fungal-type domain-containing protein n=1 Tax=Mollisia scopiformis TaxID=149040 RepID=A0A194XCX3_MOLSC|nr:uncharacterized protein LY89DRAFT_781130 [Mollisia scopiformis]KUJ18025.1 hypothetical protein LY89DRAFT_781130 [Mollisia scopiformis]